jgi:hypothetical protein
MILPDVLVVYFVREIKAPIFYKIIALKIVGDSTKVYPRMNYTVCYGQVISGPLRWFLGCRMYTITFKLLLIGTTEVSNCLVKCLGCL